MEASKSFEGSDVATITFDMAGFFGGELHDLQALRCWGGLSQQQGQEIAR